MKGVDSCCITFQDHSLLKTFLKSTELTTISLFFCHWTLPKAIDACIDALTLHGSFEKAFAPATEPGRLSTV